MNFATRSCFILDVSKLEPDRLFMIEKVIDLWCRRHCSNPYLLQKAGSGFWLLFENANDAAKFKFSKEYSAFTGHWKTDYTVPA